MADPPPARRPDGGEGEGVTPAGHRVLLLAVVVLAVGAVLLAGVGGNGDHQPPSRPIGDRDLSDLSVPRNTLPPDPGAPSTTAGAVAPSSSTAPPVGDPAVVAVGATGVYTPATGGREAVGSGDVVTYTVEVEDAVGYAADAFAAFVDQTLADGRSWIAEGGIGFQRVPADGRVRVVLATPATTDQLCLPLQTNGLYSCHQSGTVVINSDRWFGGIGGWPGPLEEYRRYAVNHEMGHAIGRGHVSCPGVGQPTPVMMQQSKGLDGCTPNGWPYP